MDGSLGEIERTAIDACRAGGAFLREAYRSENTTARRFEHDVKSSADTDAERRILDVIRSRFPEHRIEAEESGVHEGTGTYEWLVDPLDGTNNFESGLPSFATAITVLAADDPVLGVVYVPLLDDLYVARDGDGVRYNGRPVRATSDAEPSTATAVSVIGHDVKRHADHRSVSASINRALEDRCKRRLESWSPTVHWGLLARGRLDGIVCYRPDREEQLLGERFAAESGLRTETGPTWFVGAANEAVFDCLVDIASERC
ncbi:inositol monophosphatase family protein [Natrinema longum]|uniref:fructose-bisphosphatase n=1 Tax=Natrinema longum TaxID=370324 RepID=A0A8A2UHX8_9EURY|nr:inositol monophosphatase family protein [Natrinema longum]MBZ6495283.1 inositol monophosphatase [Natrinema longum]QSW86738.1 inositol monophosphatase [Natrinema longum]